MLSLVPTDSIQQSGPADYQEPFFFTARNLTTHSFISVIPLESRKCLIKNETRAIPVRFLLKHSLAYSSHKISSVCGKLDLQL